MKEKMSSGMAFLHTIAAVLIFALAVVLLWLSFHPTGVEMQKDMVFGWGLFLIFIDGGYFAYILSKLE